MAVGVQRRGGAGVPEGPLDGDDVAAGGDEPGGVEVPEVVQLHAREAGRGERRPPAVADGVLVWRLAGVPRGDPRVLAVVATPQDVRVLMAVRFSNQLVAELYQPFWAALQAGEFLTDAAAVAGTHRWRGLKWLREAGGVRPRRRAPGTRDQ